MLRINNKEICGLACLSKTRLSRPNGQALLEMALVGSVAIAALGFLIQIGLRLNYEQEERQNAFRHAMMMAKCEGEDYKPEGWCNSQVPLSINFGEESQSTTFLRFRERQMPEPSIGFALIPTTTVVDSGTATWGERLTFLADDADSQPRLVMRVGTFPAQLYRSGEFGDNPPIRQITKTSQLIGTLTQDQNGSNTRAVTIDTTDVQLNNGETISSVSPPDPQDRPW